jgi:hypothetical protein
MPVILHDVTVGAETRVRRTVVMRPVRCELCGRRQFDVELVQDGSLVVIWIQCYHRECKHKNRVVFEG